MAAVATCNAALGKLQLQKNNPADVIAVAKPASRIETPNGIALPAAASNGSPEPAEASPNGTAKAYPGPGQRRADSFWTGSSAGMTQTNRFWAGSTAGSSTVGTYLAQRMIDVGVKDYFVVPGDFNLLLLDEILKFPELRLISCCNELNAGYAADGYARAKGVAVIVVTFTVGSLSAINAIAGAFAEDLPVIVISGAPSSLAYGSDKILHHSLGGLDRGQELRCFQQVTAKAVEILHPVHAPEQIDDAFATAMMERKPVFISVACNIASAPLAPPIPMQIESVRRSSGRALSAAVADVAELWERALNPVVVIGAKVRPCKAQGAVEVLSEASKCATAVMPDSKGLFPENHPNFVGLWWGQSSSPNTAAVIDPSQLQIFVGPIFHDVVSLGSLLDWTKMVIVGPSRVRTPRGEYGSVYMVEFLEALSKRLSPKPNTMQRYRRLMEYLPSPRYKLNKEGKELTMRNVDHAVRLLLNDSTTLFTETGSVWFHTCNLALPRGCGYEIQMVYCSLGWAVGAVLGYALATKGQRRAVALIGDGAFQMTAQEVSTMIRYDVDPIIFLINNDGYTIEVEIHDGIYNNTKMWDYKAVVESFANKEGNARCWQVKTEEALMHAVAEARDHRGLAFIECVVQRDDSAKELLQFGAQISYASAKK